MNTRIQQLLSQMATLEDELRTALHEREEHVEFTLRGKRIEFAQGVRIAHQRLKRGLFRWIVTDRPQNFITGPIIYSMIVPLCVLDFCVTLYQMTCFPIYGIAKARRGDYIVFDRHQLGFLNIVERFHCEYCAYGNGVLAYAMEIVGRTEQYFCPIKHARKILGTHRLYQTFIEFGDSADFHAKLEAFRVRGQREGD